ncbi:MAG: nucleoside deaminase [Rikenellaceae bacterium]|nr:nucleoside deaminase [Rikenellaceae bacterium]
MEAKNQNQEQHERFMRMAIELADMSVATGGGPFGAVIVRDGEVVARGTNNVTKLNDPTAHAEVQAIRHACAELETFNLKGCTVYTSCEPCPMCLSALYWAGVDRIYYANTRSDAAAIDFDDSLIYDEIPKAHTERQIPAFQLLREEALHTFRLWQQKEDKVEY